jgi:hypothetical protein
VSGTLGFGSGVDDGGGLTGVDSGLTGVDSGLTGVDSGLTGVDGGLVGVGVGFISTVSVGSGFCVFGGNSVVIPPTSVDAITDVGSGVVPSCVNADVGATVCVDVTAPDCVDVGASVARCVDFGVSVAG